MMGTLLNLLIFTLTIESGNKEFIGEVSYTGGTELLSRSFTLYDKEGNKLYSILNPGAVNFFISNFGVVFAASERQLFLYELNGDIKELLPLDYPNGFGYSPDNTLFFVSDRNGVYAFALSGKLVYQFNPGRLFASTEMAQRFCVVSNDTISFYEEGRLRFIRIIESPFVRSIKFSPDGKFVHLEMPSFSVLYNFETGEIEKR